MIKNPKQDSGLFFWIKGGEEESQKSIHSIQPKQQATHKIKMVKDTPKSEIDTARAGLKPGWTRATLILREDNLNKIKALAYWDRKNIKDILDEALTVYLKKKNIKPMSDNDI
jgi:hypothetical protein